MVSFKTFLQRNWLYLLLDVAAVLVVALTVWYMSLPPVVAPPTLAEVRDAREQGLQWLERNFDGRLFVYRFAPRTDEEPDVNNTLRQLMASRVAAVEAPERATFAQIHSDNLAFVFEYWYREDDNGGFVFYDEKSKLGSNAMLLRTLAYSPRFDEYAQEAAQVAKGIKALQNEDGSFRPWYIEPDYEYEAEYLMYFYSGEAILALVEYYERSGDRASLVAAQQAADYYRQRYSEEIDEHYHPAYVPWHTMAYSHLFAITGDERYRDAAFVMNDRLLELLDWRNYPGRFYKPELAHEGQEGPHSSSDAVYLEGLLYAYELAVEAGETERAQRYREAVEVAAARLVDLQYTEVRKDFAAAPETYLGAMRIHEGNSRVRVDTIQHTLDALAKYLTVFGEAPPAAS